MWIGEKCAKALKSPLKTLTYRNKSYLGVGQGYTGVISWGHGVRALKDPKLSQTKVFDKKSENFLCPGVGPVKPRFLAFSWVSCHFGSQLLNDQT